MVSPRGLVLRAWADLGLAWQACFELAWEAYGAGTVPVGAVVVDADGTIVARGRNRIFDAAPATGQLAGSYLAHAEVNALADLPPSRRYTRHRLFTFLEPCLLCFAATRLATVGSLAFAGTDPFGGAASLDVRDLNPMTRFQWVEVEGPLALPLGLLATALHLEFYVRRQPEGPVTEYYAGNEPALLRAAEAVAAAGGPARAAAGEPIAAALPSLVGALEAAL